MPTIVDIAVQAGKFNMLCCEDARLSSGTCSCADLVELMHAPARPPRRVRNPSSQQSKFASLLEIDLAARG
jgi:hypothetical protein